MKIRSLVCEECGFVASKKGTLKHHVKTLHENISFLDVMSRYAASNFQMYSFKVYLQATFCFLLIIMSTLSTDMFPNPNDFMHCFNMLTKCTLLL